MKKIVLVTLIINGIIQAAMPPDTCREATWTTNGWVSSIAQSGNIVYLGGDFTYVGPYTGSGVPIDAASGSPVAKFPKISGQILASCSDGNGGWYVGGSLSSVDGISRNNIAHILSNGTLDANWNPSADSNVNSIVVSGNTVYAGGWFTSIGGQTRNYIAALDATTGQATSWNPNANYGVISIAVSGNTVYVGGWFTSIGGQARNYIAALDATTGQVTSWNPSADSAVSSIVVSGNTVYAGGGFSSIGGQTRNYIAALDATTGQATSWNPNADRSVLSIVVSGNTVYAGGGFDSIGGQARNNIAALDATTGQPTLWNPSASSRVNSIVVSGNTVYTGGWFTSIGGRTRNKIAALDATTGQATSWNPSVSDGVNTITVSGNTVYAGGDFNSFGGQARNYIAALNATTGQATSWNPNANGEVVSITVSGNTVYAGGSFGAIGGQTRYNIAALDATTGQPTSWNPGIGMAWGVGRVGEVYFSVSGNTVYVGGNFWSIRGQIRHSIAALDATTGQPTSWNPNAANSNLVTATVPAIVVSGNTVYAGGTFTSIGGQTRKYIAALDATTGQATSWYPTSPNGSFNGATGFVSSIAVSGNTVYAGGEFTSIGVQTRKYIAALDAATGQPTSWNPDANNVVYFIVVSGNTVYAGGRFTSIGGQTRNRIAALDAISGQATSWNPSAVGGVNSLAVSGNTVYVGGQVRPGMRCFYQFGEFYPAPTAPTLVAPSNCATNQPSNVTLQWNVRADASTYRVQVSTNFDFSGVIVDDSAVTDTFKVIGPLSGYGAMAFYWRVMAKNAAASSDWSRPWAFSTGTPLLLDDFEDGDNGNKIGTYWYFWADSNSTIHNAGPNKEFIGGYTPGNGSMYAGIMDFTVKGGSGSPEAGMGFDFDAAGDSVDLSGAKAVQFDVKGNRPMVIQLNIPQATIHDYNYYNTKIGIDTSWTTVLVSLSKGFSALSQEHWGDTATFAINKLTGLQWIFRPRNGTDLESSGKVSIDNIKLIGSPAGLHAPFAPFVIWPAWGAANQPLSPLMKWRSSAGATSYSLQISKSQTFAPFVVNQSGITDTVYQISGLDTGTVYYWRVNATGGGLTSRWSYATSFRTFGKLAIIVNPGWNMISLNIHPEDSSAQGIFSSLRGFVLAKNNTGLVYWPAYGINNLGIHMGNGYKVYTDSLDTLQVAGSPINVATTPIPLSAGWNMTAYLPQSNMPIVTALSGVVSQITLVKDNLGQVYMPDLGINTIGDMQVGQGYKMYMKNMAVLAYPSGGILKLLAEGKKPTPSLPGHYQFKRNTGSNATILAKQVTIGGVLAADNSEIGVFNENGNLVGGGVVVKGKGAFCVWGDDPQTKEKDGCAVGEKLSFKLWNGTQEYPIECQGTGLQYHEDGIYIAAFSVQGALFIKNFTLKAASSNPFRNRMTILFDIPAINGKDAQDVEINIYGLNGRLVHQLVKGKYTTGHYSATWHIGKGALSGSNMYIVQMKAANFDSKLRLFQVK